MISKGPKPGPHPTEGLGGADAQAVTPRQRLDERGGPAEVHQLRVRRLVVDAPRDAPREQLRRGPRDRPMRW